MCCMLYMYACIVFVIAQKGPINAILFYSIQEFVTLKENVQNMKFISRRMLD